MEPSQYKDDVLVLLFVKYVSDKHANDPNGLIKIPVGGSFKEMQALKGQKDIGEKIDVAISSLVRQITGVAKLEKKVHKHLQKIEFVWND